MNKEKIAQQIRKPRMERTFQAAIFRNSVTQHLVLEQLRELGYLCAELSSKIELDKNNADRLRLEAADKQEIAPNLSLCKTKSRLSYAAACHSLASHLSDSLETSISKEAELERHAQELMLEVAGLRGKNSKIKVAGEGLRRARAAHREAIDDDERADRAGRRE